MAPSRRSVQSLHASRLSPASLVDVSTTDECRSPGCAGLATFTYARTVWEYGSATLADALRLQPCGRAPAARLGRLDPRHRLLVPRSAAGLAASGRSARVSR